MTKEEISALLGRSLTSIEDTNFDLYLDIAFESLEALICTPIESVTETRVFDTRHDYKTAFIDIFNEITEVKLNGDVTTDYTVRQWDKRNASWYNSLVFEDYLGCKDLEVTADWGFLDTSGADSDLPVDLQSLVAGLFGLITKKNKFDGTIASKQVEDFRVSFNVDADLDQAFYQNYNSIISKYSLCDIPNVQSGKINCSC